MATSIKKRRALSDLFMEGVEVRFGKDPETGKPTGRIGPFVDDEGRPLPPRADEFAMYVRPPDPYQREQAMREANAKRARALVKAKRDEDSEEHLTIMAFLADMEDSTLVDYVLLGDANLRQAEAQREILAEEEWKEMPAYQDALRQFSAMDPGELEGNAEWEAFLELDAKFSNQVAKRERELTDAQRDVLGMLSREQLERKALEKRAEMIGTQAFLDEYQLQTEYFAVRDPEDTTKLYFESAMEFAGQHQTIRDTISEALLPFISDEAEAKNSQGAAVDGSTSSVPPAKQETSAASTPGGPTE